jgi:GDP-L-fucose synthase
MEKNSKIYIAGHNGMVGSAICRNLIANDYVNLVYTPSSSYDLTNQKIVFDFFSKEKPEYVFLAAAKVGGIISNNTFRAQFIYENLMIQNNIIHQSYLHGVKKLIFPGSSCIYPKNCPQPIKEEFLLTGELEFTNEPFAIAKIAGIKMCESYNLQYGTNFIPVMPTNLYGPNDNYNFGTSHVLPALMSRMHLGKCLENHDWEEIRKDLKKHPIDGLSDAAPESEIIENLSRHGIQYTGKSQSTNQSVTITLWGTGNPLREFLYVDDLADAFIFIMNHVNFTDLIAMNAKPNSIVSKQSSDIKNTHINIGTGRDNEIKEIAQMIKNIVGFKGQLNWDNSKPDGTFRKLLDVSKINRLGWKEKIGLEEGIKLVYDQYSK